MREVAKGNPLYPPQGMERKRIHFILVINSDGTLVDIEPYLNPNSLFINVIRSRSRAGKNAAITPNYMWDSLAYVTGYGDDVVRLRAFKDMVQDAHSRFPNNKSFSAVRNFYHKGVEQLFEHSLWGEVSSKVGHNLTFRLVGETLTSAEQEELATKPTNRIACIHPKLFIQGASGTGAKVVSFKNNSSGYNSYMKQEGYIAQVSEIVAAGYANAITVMREKGSGHSLLIGDVTFLFFMDNDKSDFNLLFEKLFVPNDVDLEAYRECEEIFNIIALVPNAARISARMHLRIKVKDVVESIDNLYTYIPFGTSLVAPLIAIAPFNEVGRLSSQFRVDYIKAIVTGGSFPIPFLQLLLKDRTFHPVRLGVLRYYLNKIETKNYIPMALNQESTNIGYLLGRMMAIVERAQTVSQPGITFTIKDALYATLSVTPAALFNRVM